MPLLGASLLTTDVIFKFQLVSIKVNLQHYASLNKYIFQNKQHSQYIHTDSDFFEIATNEVNEHIAEYS